MIEVGFVCMDFTGGTVACYIRGLDMVLVCWSQPGTHAEYEYFQRVLRYRTLFPSTTRGALVPMVMVVKVKCGKAAAANCW
jgi:hypothetical protein